MDPDKAIFLNSILPLVVTLSAIGVAGWVITTWMRIKHGYPLIGGWGQALHPKTDRESMERIRILTQENAELRAELGSIKDRMANVERIVTDGSHQLTQDIEALRSKAN